MSPTWCECCDEPIHRCKCGGRSGGNFGYTNYGRRSPSLYSYASTASRTTQYSDIFDRNSTASSASSNDFSRCYRCDRIRSGGLGGCQCLRNQPSVPNRMSQPSHRRNSPPPRRDSPPPRSQYNSYNSGSSANMCYRCRRSKRDCTCIPGTLYNPGGFSNSRTAYENHPAFDDEPAWMQSSNTRTSNSGGNDHAWCERCDYPARSCACSRR